MKKEIYLAGGCFWGTEHYFQKIKGVLSTKVGYANGNTLNPTYEEVCHKNTGHAETVKVIYDSDIISLPFLLELYYDVINPVSINRQGGDTGVQYRTGIYFVENRDREIIEHSISKLQKNYHEKIAIEVKPLEHFFAAEEYHQKYLDKNPAGYCHIGKEKFNKAEVAYDPEFGIVNKSPDFSAFQATIYSKKTKQELREKLTQLQYDVTMNNHTEAPFQNEYYDQFQEGIYVDITTGEPLFVSTDKFESGCGWPSFSKPIDPSVVWERKDFSHAMIRKEVRSKTGDIHLGHVFTDGPKEKGGLRYCINSAALRFVPREEMVQQGYEQFMDLL